MQFLLVTDLDNTLVGDDRALAELNHRLTQHRQQYGTKLVYATGRSPILYEQLAQEKSLLPPDALVASVGTEIYHQGQATPDPDWEAKLASGWDRNQVIATAAHFADLVMQPETEQRPYKVSYFLTENAATHVLPQLEQQLQAQQLAVQLIYSGGYDLDILPRPANKGLAMTFLRQQWGIAPEHTVACGDSGNDLALFTIGEERGIIVGNARSELLHWYQTNPSPRCYLAQGHCAAGILEGLHHFGFF